MSKSNNNQPNLDNPVNTLFDVSNVRCNYNCDCCPNGISINSYETDDKIYNLETKQQPEFSNQIITDIDEANSRVIAGSLLKNAHVRVKNCVSTTFMKKELIETTPQLEASLVGFQGRISITDEVPFIQHVLKTTLHPLRGVYLLSNRSDVNFSFSKLDAMQKSNYIELADIENKKSMSNRCFHITLIKKLIQDFTTGQNLLFKKRVRFTECVYVDVFDKSPKIQLYGFVVIDLLKFYLETTYGNEENASWKKIIRFVSEKNNTIRGYDIYM